MFTKLFVIGAVIAASLSLVVGADSVPNTTTANVQQTIAAARSAKVINTVESARTVQSLPAADLNLQFYFAVRNLEPGSVHKAFFLAYENDNEYPYFLGYNQQAAKADGTIFFPGVSYDDLFYYRDISEVKACLAAIDAPFTAEKDSEGNEICQEYEIPGKYEG